MTFTEATTNMEELVSKEIAMWTKVSPANVTATFLNNGVSTSYTFPNKAKQNELAQRIGAVIEGGTFHAHTWGEAIQLIEACSGKTITHRNYIVTLPSGTFKKDWSLDLVNTGKDTRYSIILRGAGKGKTIVQNEGDSSMLSLNNAHMVVEHITFDGENRTHPTVRLNYASKLIFTKNTVEIRNSFSSNAIYVINKSFFIADALELNSVAGGCYFHSQSYGNLNNLKHTTPTNHTQHTSIRAYVGSEVNINNAKIVGIKIGLGAGYNVRIYARKTKIEVVKGGIGVVSEYNSTVVFEYGEIIGESNRGILSKYSSNIRANHITIKGAERGIYATRNSYIECDHAILKNICQYGIMVYDSSFVIGSYLNIHLKKTAIRHFHLDKAKMYTRNNRLRGGKEIASIHYDSLFQFYNTTDIAEINNGSSTNYISINSMSILQEGGSKINCNIPNNTFREKVGTRF